MLKGVPSGSIGKTSDSGWSNEEIFLFFLEHFIMHTNPSPDHPLILIMDNHQSHISIPVINNAKSAGVILLTIPLHSSYKIKPLDKTIYGPFKTFYFRAMTDWLNNPGNKGKPVTIYEVAELAGRAYESAFTLKNIVSGFRTCGLFPLNRDIFQEEDFLPSNLSGLILFLDAEASQPPTLEIRTPTLRTRASEDPPQNEEIILSAANSSVEAPTDAPTPESLRPFPVRDPSRGKSIPKKQKSVILTDRPEKEKTEQRRKKKSNPMPMHPKAEKNPKCGRRRIEFEMSSSDDDISVISLKDSDSDQDFEEEICAQELENNFLNEDVGLKDGDFILVKCKRERGYQRHFVAKVIKRGQKETEIKYLKKMQKTDTFVFNEETETYIVNEEDIILQLPNPQPLAGTSKRKLSQFTFPVNFNGYTLG